VYLTFSCILFLDLTEFECIYIDFNKTFILLFALVNTYVEKICMC
jgi:diacylglycerol kinase